MIDLEQIIACELLGTSQSGGDITVKEGNITLASIATFVVLPEEFNDDLIAVEIEVDGSHALEDYAIGRVLFANGFKDNNEEFTFNGSTNLEANSFIGIACRISSTGFGFSSANITNEDGNIRISIIPAYGLAIASYKYRCYYK